MAFIREYAAASGDPFRFRLPKIGRLLKKGIGLAAHFVPGGGLVAKGLDLVGKVKGGKRAMRALAFARAYGAAAGDPGAAPAPKNRRKAAASGPHHKANTKAAHRAGTPQSSAAAKRRGHGGGSAILGALGQGAHAVGSAIPDLLASFKKGGATGAMTDLALGNLSPDALAAAHGLHLGGGAHRRINPTNVKALRRSLRRVESFATLAHKVQKDAGKILRHVKPEHHTSSGGGRGHKAGCGCVVCRRK